MRKITAFILVITMAFIFAACGKNKEEPTTLDPLYTAYSPVVTNGQSSQQNGAGATYVLTTNQSKTAPVLVTTSFVAAPATTAKTTSATSAPGATSGTTTTNSLVYTTTGGTIAPPTVVTSKTQTTTWATIATTTTRPTTTKPTTKATTTTRPTTTRPTTTAKPEPVAMDVSINEVGMDTQGRFYAAIDSSGWGGSIKANSGRVTVYVDGVPMDEQVMLQISSSTTGDGYQYVYLNLADYGIDPSSSTISFEIPEGFLENKTGTKYNYSAEISS